MLKLNLFWHLSLLILPDLNTSYVKAKHRDGGEVIMEDMNLNTSYVKAKLIETAFY